MLSVTKQIADQLFVTVLLLVMSAMTAIFLRRKRRPLAIMPALGLKSMLRMRSLHGLAATLGGLAFSAQPEDGQAAPASPTDTFGGLSQISLRTTRLYKGITCALTALALWLVWAELEALAQGPQNSGFVLTLSVLISAAVLWHLVWVLSWRMDYDSIGLSAPNRWLRREARMWRQLTAVSYDGPFITQLHFVDGLIMRVPNFIQGRDELLTTAFSWLDHGHAPNRPQ